MIKDMQPISMAEVVDYLEKDSGDSDLKGFIKKFVKTKPAKAKELRKTLEEFELMKMKTEHIVKIIDFLPENSEDLNKIFTDVGLDEDEIKKILEAVKQYK